MSKIKPTLEKSELEASKIIDIQMIVGTLDLEYLKAALETMQENHAFRESAAVLSPSPFTFHESQLLNALKLKQLNLFIKLRENLDKIAQAELNLNTAQNNADKMREIFNL